MENTDCCIPNPEIDTGSDQVQRFDICNENFSDGYCSDCEAHMCQTCFDRHLKTRPCRHHILRDNTNDQTLVTKTHSEPCKLHKNQTIEFYCVDHSNVGCAKCMLSDHSPCNRENIEVAAKRYQDDGGVARLSKKMQELDNVYTECMQRVQLLTQSVAATNDKTVNDIESFKASININVDETVRVALEKAENLRIDNENKVDKLSVDLKTIGNSIRLFKDTSESKDTFEKLFIVAMETEPMLGNFQERLSTLKNENVNTEFKFHPHEIILDIITNSRLLGEVYRATEESDNYMDKLEQLKKKYINECAKTHSLEQQVRDRDEQIKKLTCQLNKANTPIQAVDSSKMGISVTQEGIKVMVYKSNILTVNVDCIANAVNCHLQHGGGVARVIARAAGFAYEYECKEYIRSHRKLSVGQVCSTTAGNLKHKCVINAAGPAWCDYRTKTPEGRKACEDDLMQTVLNSLHEAERKGMKSIALPAISSAIFGVPIVICTNQYVRAVKMYSSAKAKCLDSALSEIHFIDVNEATVGAIKDAFSKAFRLLELKIYDDI